MRSPILPRRRRELILELSSRTIGTTIRGRHENAFGCPEQGESTNSRCESLDKYSEVGLHPGGVEWLQCRTMGCVRYSLGNKSASESSSLL